jgi:uncharacterized protein
VSTEQAGSVSGASGGAPSVTPAATRHVVADPLPLGIGAFAMTTFALSIANTNIWGAGASAALALALVYGGTVQLLAGMWEFVRKNTFGATAFSSYGAFWISYYVLSKFVLPGAHLSKSDTAVAVGVFLLGWTVFTFYMTIASLRVTAIVVLVFVLLTATFVLLTIGAFNSSTNLDKAGGWVGVATAAAAWYASFAGVTNETFKRTILPVVPLAR